MREEFRRVEEPEDVFRDVFVCVFPRIAFLITFPLAFIPRTPLYRPPTLFRRVHIREPELPVAGVGEL